MKRIPEITLIAIDTIKYGQTINSLINSLEQIEPFETIWYTDIFINQPFRIQEIKHLYSKNEYSHFCIKELGTYEFKTSHILITQWDGYVLDGNSWEDEFLEYDYIGAPWLYIDGRNCGNGGFSLRSVKLHNILAEDPFIKGYNPEDDAICRLYRPYLEDKYNIKFAPEEVAHRFAFELHEPKQPTFGFHGNFHPKYQPTVVIRRTGALGDCIQCEPVLEYFWKTGHKVVFDSPFFLMYSRNPYPIHDYQKFDHAVIKHRVIDLDMSYESMPQQLHLKSYFEIAGVKDYVLRNPKLHYQANDSNRLFKRYVVIHIDRRDTETRNIHGIYWKRVITELEGRGFQVIQIGRGWHETIALEFNAVNDLVLMWLLSGASLMIGIDSGPTNMAVALGVKSIIFFGSVTPSYIYADLSNIIALQSACPISTPGCWHSVQGGTRGVECAVHDVEVPPCTVISTDRVLEAINKML